MRRRGFLLLAAALTMAACQRDVARDGSAAAPASDAAAAAAPVAARTRVVALGDSLTAGLGLLPDQAWPALVQQKITDAGLDVEVVNAGVSGDTTAGGLRRLDWALDGDVKVLVIELGANDGLRGLPTARTRQNLETIIGRAKARGIKVLLTGMEAPPNYGQAFTSDFRRLFRDLAETHDVAFMPFYLDGVAGNPALNIADGIHPNPEGARIVADNLWRTLAPLLEKPRS